MACLLRAEKPRAVCELRRRRSRRLPRCFSSPSRGDFLTLPLSNSAPESFLGAEKPSLEPSVATSLLLAAWLGLHFHSPSLPFLPPSLTLYPSLSLSLALPLTDRGVWAGARREPMRELENSTPWLEEEEPAARTRSHANTRTRTQPHTEELRSKVWCRTFKWTRYIAD